jgi:hypothetical protein
MEQESSMNIQLLAEEILLAALREARGEGQEARLARRWLAGLGTNDWSARIETVCSRLQAVWEGTGSQGAVGVS